MNAIIGQLLLWVGFLSGALATVFATAPYARLGINLVDGFDDRPAVIKGLPKKSLAHQAGLREGDQLLTLNGKAIDKTGDFEKMLGAIGEEGAVKITYSRGIGESATTGTANLPATNPWITVDWVWYLVSLSVGIAGICFLHAGKRTKASSGQASEQGQANLNLVGASLDNVVTSIESMKQKVSEMKPREILKFIEQNLVADLGTFADGRDCIADEFGLEVFANVMTPFAAGERAINRAWSASADGYVNEAETCIERGLALFTSAQKILKSA